MSALVILDGGDASGKTTLADQFRKQYGAVILHQIYRWKDNMFDYHTAVLRRAIKHMLAGKLVVLDRWWPSELIYSRVYRGGSKVPHEGRFMDRVALKHAGVYIFCGRDARVVAHRHQELAAVRKEMFSGQMDEVAELYTRFVEGRLDSAGEHRCKPRDYTQFHEHNGGFSYGRPDVLQYSIEYEGCDLPKFVAEVVNQLRVWRGKQFQLALTGYQNVLGHLNLAKFLFVGDRCNPKRRNMFWPFYEYGHSSLFMTECLHALGFREEQAMWTNACVESPCVSALLASKPALRVIALGQNAAKRLDTWGISYQMISHPQRGARFDRRGFMRQLEDVLQLRELQPA